jgi:hypothetical protein
MAWFIRKALRVGPFRLNLSKGGLGVSVGVKGLRVGANPRGNISLFAGRFGLYFRERVGKVSGGPAIMLAVAVVAIVAALALLALIVQ